jgi:uridine kinase
VVESGDPQVQLSVSTWRQPLPPAASLQRAALLEQVAAQILACGEGRLRVAVDGLTASGKTSFGHEIAQLILRSGRPVLRASAQDAVLIVDGVFAFRPEINDCWDFRIWLEIDPELAVQRGTRRDQDWAGLEAEALHRNRYLASEHLYIAEVDPIRLADLVIDNSRFDQPEVINKLVFPT